MVFMSSYLSPHFEGKFKGYASGTETGWKYSLGKLESQRDPLLAFFLSCSQSLILNYSDASVWALRQKGQRRIDGQMDGHRPNRACFMFSTVEATSIIIIMIWY